MNADKNSEGRGYFDSILGLITAELAKEFPQLAELMPVLCPDNPDGAPQEEDAAPASANLLAPGQRLGEFELGQEIGRGGMGVVFEAEDVKLGRQVALKVLHPGRAFWQDDLERFWREAKAVSQLEHPGIVPVYVRGEDRGLHYFAMKLVEGENLTSVLDALREQRGLPFQGTVAERARKLALALREGKVPGGGGSYHRSVAALIAGAADALHHAHRHEVIHRDVKPANLILGEDLRVYLTDFGLARSGQLPALSAPGDRVGTLRYMSPEQVRGKVVDHRTDVYSLGAILYEFLTGQPLVPDGDPVTVENQIRNPAWVRPARVDPDVPYDLETIALKALAREPRYRYTTAAEMAEDLRRFAGEQPIRAKRPGPGVLAARWVRSSPRRAAGVIAGLVILVGGLVGLTAWAVQAENVAAAAERAAGQEKAEAVQAREQAARELSERRVALAREAWERGEVRLMQELLAAERPTPGAKDRRDWEWYYLSTLARNGTLLAPMTAEVVNGASWSPRGDSVALAVENPAPDAHGAEKGTRGRVEVREASTGRLLRAFCAQAEYPIDVVAWSPDGKSVAAGYGPGVVSVWDVATRRETFHELWEGPVSSLAWSPGGTLLAAGTLGAVRVWDVRERHARVVFSSSVGGHRLTWSSNGSLLVALGWEQVVGFEIPSGRESFRFFVDGAAPDERSIHRPRTVEDAAVSPDGKLVATAHKDRLVAVWDAASGKQLRTFAGHTLEALTVAWSPDGKRLASGGLGGELRLWDAGSGQALGRYRGHHGSVRSLAWDPRGRSLLSVGARNELRVWDTGRPQDALRVQAGVDWSSGPLVDGGTWNWWLLWSPDSRSLASVAGVGDVASFEYRVVRWDSSTGGQLESLPWDETGADTRRLFWEGGELRRGAQIDLPPARLSAPGGKRMARVCGEGADQRVEIVDSARGTQIHLLNELGAPEPFCWSPDGSHLVLNRAGRTSRVWDAATGKPVLTLPELGQSPFAWSPDGRLLAARPWSWDSRGKVQVWDVRRRAEVLSLTAGGRHVTTLAWHPGGARLAAGFNDGTVLVWDATTGREVITLNGHGTANVLALAWSPDGKRLASKDLRGTIRVWDASPAYDEPTRGR